MSAILSPSSPKTLIIVEDTSMYMKQLMAISKKLGTDFIVVDNGRDAEDLLTGRRFGRRFSSPGLAGSEDSIISGEMREKVRVVLDDAMPQKNGTDVIRTVREWERSQSVTPVMVAAHSSEANAELLTAGCDIALMKPTTQKEIEKFLSK